VKTFFDTNVIVANMDEAHEHHEWSSAILQQTSAPDILVSAHSLAEAFNRLTRGGASGTFRPEGTAAALRDLSTTASVRALDTNETMDAISRFAAMGGARARLYDYLIGYVAVAVVERVERIITWNIRDMRPLFAHLDVITPKEAIGA